MNAASVPKQFWAEMEKTLVPKLSEEDLEVYSRYKALDVLAGKLCLAVSVIQVDQGAPSEDRDMMIAHVEEAFVNKLRKKDFGDEQDFVETLIQRWEEVITPPKTVN